MTERLFIFISRQATVTQWFIQQDDQVIAEGSDLPGLQEREEKAKQTIVILPYEDVVVRTVSIPGKNQKQRLKAAPFALEEHIATDLDDMHFAFKTESGTDQILVLGITHQVMQKYLDALEELGIEPDVVLTSAALLETPADSISVMQLDTSYLINDGESRWQASEDLARVQLELMQSESEPRDLLFWSHESPSDWMTGMNFELHAEEVISPWYSLIARYDNRSPNLLSGNYAKAVDLFESVQQWKRTIQFAAALLILQFIFMVVELTYLSNARDGIKEDIVSLYQEVSPGARVVDARRQMQQLINQRKGAGLSSSSFPLMLQGLTESIQKSRGIQTTNLNYSQQSSELRVDLLASNLSQFDGLKQALEQKGYLVTMGGATAQGQQYSGRLIMRNR